MQPTLKELLLMLACACNCAAPDHRPACCPRHNAQKHASVPVQTLSRMRNATASHAHVATVTVPASATPCSNVLMQEATTPRNTHKMS
jgi:hypothetical protein